MKGGAETQPQRVRLPTREELKLWRSATAGVITANSSALVRSKPEASAIANAVTSSVLSPEFLSKGLAVKSASSKSTVDRAFAPLAPFDKRLKRRLTSRKLQPDDVIDLHGMTQVQAYGALGPFLRRSAESGAKLVLVITGKGSSIADENAHLTEKGVLRRNAPHWLRSPALRSIVLSVEEAAPPHGGCGAFYVRLRRYRPA
jgi:DNA-nicking Smr family endonuclease